MDAYRRISRADSQAELEQVTEDLRSAYGDPPATLRTLIRLVELRVVAGDAVVVDATLDPDPVLVDGDEDLLHRVVTNLVLNAVQAAEPGRKTRIDVEVSGIAGDHTVPGIDVADAVVLRVTDDGPGIPEENLNRIFDPFFSGRSGGTGLGLSIVHRAVEAHGGTVLVESTIRKGTRFTVLLPGQPSRS